LYHQLLLNGFEQHFLHFKTAPFVFKCFSWTKKKFCLWNKSIFIVCVVVNFSNISFLDPFSHLLLTRIKCRLNRKLNFFFFLQFFFRSQFTASTVWSIERFKLKTFQKKEMYFLNCHQEKGEFSGGNFVRES